MDTLHGTIQNGQIQLKGNPPLPEGAQVKVHIVPAESTSQQAARERIESYRGLPDWSAEDDRILEEIEADRRRPSRRFNADQDPFA